LTTAFKEMYHTMPQNLKLNIGSVYTLPLKYERKFPEIKISIERVKLREEQMYTKVYPKVSGLAACNANCKRYSSLPSGAVVSLFCESV
jgi:hypothetical protein